MERIRLGREDGFFREILWAALVLVIAAAAVLDGMAIFTAHQQARDEALKAARGARTVYVETGSVDAARLAAAESLRKAGLRLAGFSVHQDLAGETRFTVTTAAEAETYLFRYLGLIPPLKDWVDDVTHPSATRSSD
jgi:hypothetical protein